MALCSRCGQDVEARFRFCPWCAVPLRRKLVEFFPARPGFEPDVGKALRVSRYLGPEPEDRHVRFSVWDETGAAVGAVSIVEIEAERLSAFLAPKPAPPGLLESLRTLIRT